MNAKLSSITVCICTYKRPQMLKRLLTELACQHTEGLFTYSIVIVDNDHSRSAEDVVTAFKNDSETPVTYLVEPRQNIALARNSAIDNSTSDFIAFIDDDEYPIRTWLLALFNALAKYAVDGVLGPVKPHFDVEPPRWVIEGRFYDRPSYSTGFVVDWNKGRTGNVLLRREVVDSDKQPFNPDFRTGEDQDFFRRMIARGYVFIWCDEAAAYEVVPPLRWKPKFMLKRALLQGISSQLHPNFGQLKIAKSLFAVPLYAAALPVALLLGRLQLMLCMIKLCNHIGRLFGLAGIDPVKEPYVTA